MYSEMKGTEIERRCEIRPTAVYSNLGLTLELCESEPTVQHHLSLQLLLYGLNTFNNPWICKAPSNLPNRINDHALFISIHL